MNKLEKLREQLAENVQASKRQIEFAGVRMGVFARLKELERERDKIIRKIDKLELSQTEIAQSK